MSKLVGIDSSTTRTALSLFIDGEYVGYELIDCKKLGKTQWERLPHMMLKIGEVLDKWQPDIIFQEDSWKGRNVDTLKCLTNILGGVRYWAIANGCDYRKVLPSEWRAKLKLNEYLAKRPELKDNAMRFVEDVYGIECESDDVSDCICIGLAGLIWGN